MSVPGNLYTPTIRKTRGGYVIPQSLRFNDDDSAYLTRTPAGAGNLKTWTFSAWVKLGNLGVTRKIFSGAGSSGGSISWLQINSSNVMEIFVQSDSAAQLLAWDTTRLFRDPIAWYHVVWKWDTTPATPEIQLWINGVEVTAFTKTWTPSQNADSGLNTANAMRVGRRADASGDYFDGYLAEVAFVDGTAYEATDFGEFDGRGQWVPKDLSGLTFGTNGFWLDFANSADLGNDVSGNANDFTPTNLVAADQVLDSPTDDATLGIGNYATLNPNIVGGDGGSHNIKNGNLTYFETSASLVDSYVGTITMLEGKYYWEVTLDSGTISSRIGIASTNDRTATAPVGASSIYPGRTAGSWVFNAWASGAGAGKKENNATASSYYDTTVSATDVIGVCYDADNGAVWISVNNSWVDGDGADSSATVKAEIEAGTVASAMFSSLTGAMVPVFTTDGVNMEATVNFGQTAFTYTPPTGFSALATQNLPAPEIKDPSAHFGVVGDTGTGAAKDVTFGGNSTLTADLLIRKNRDQSDEWKVVDRIRGATKELNTDSTAAESTDANGIDDLSVTDGFGLGTGAGGYNDSTEKFITYGFKADGTTGASNSDGDVTSTISVNDTAGFSYGTFTTSSSASTAFTIGHGQSAAPEMIWAKRVSGGTGGWFVYHVSLGNTKYFGLHDGTPPTTATFWNDTTPTTSVFTMHTGHTGTSIPYEFFAFRSIPGYSKIGSYTGNGSADGPFVPLGFRPKFFFSRSLSGTRNNVVFDTVRDPYNVATLELVMDDATYEGPAIPDTLDFLSNGLKIRSSAVTMNESAVTISFWAIADVPFGGADVSQARAR